MSFVAIITCKGRLHHLIGTLPLLLERTPWQVVLVDYSCPDHCGEWAKKLGSRVHVVSVPGRARFNKPAAINEGFHFISHTWYLENEDVILTDADTIILPEAHETIHRVYVQADENDEEKPLCFVSGSREKRDLFGFTVLPWGAFERVGGPDPAMIDWGAEDIEYRMRLHFLGGYPFHVLDPAILDCIPHSNEERAAFYGEKKLALSNDRNINVLSQNYHLWTGRSIGDDAGREDVQKLLGTYWLKKTG